MNIDIDTARAVRDLRIAALIALGRSDEAASLPTLDAARLRSGDVGDRFACIVAEEAWLADLAGASRARAGQALARTAYFRLQWLENFGYSATGSIEADLDLTRRTATLTILLDPTVHNASSVDVSVRTAAGFIRGARASKDGVVNLPDIPLTKLSPADWTLWFEPPVNTGPRNEGMEPNVTGGRT